MASFTMEEEVAEGGTERGSVGFHRFPRDLLRGFAGNACAIEEQQQREATGGDSEEIELSLGLSLGGCFGEDPKGKKLVRSSSVASFSSPQWEPPGFPPAFPTLARASSLPSGIQEELRKRKELQSLKRLEAKRKRLERRNSIKSGAAAKAADKLDEVVAAVAAAVAASPMVTDESVGFGGGSQCGPGARNAAAAPAWPSADGFPPLATQRSIGSQGSCSIAASAQGFSGGISRSNSCSKAMSLANGKTLAASAGGEGGDDGSYPCKKAAGARGGPNGMASKDAEKSMMEQMPCVSTRGDGPNGRRVDGFLYKYNKGEQVSIVCVCHGSFLTPAEFVKHAGGGDVAHPLRHIVVNPSSFASL